MRIGSEESDYDLTNLSDFELVFCFFLEDFLSRKQNKASNARQVDGFFSILFP